MPYLGHSFYESPSAHYISLQSADGNIFLKVNALAVSLKTQTSECLTLISGPGSF